MDRLVTLFGGGGFLGRYVAQALFRTGARVRIAQRDPGGAFYLRPLAAVGQFQFVAADIRDPAEVREAVREADAVVNLVGILRGNFHAVHVAGARNVAEAAAAEGVSAFVHVSAIGADPESDSAYGRTKGEGEQAVRGAFPGATIVRPSLLFGREDAFINRFANLARLLPVLPAVRAKMRMQPVYALDVARAIAAAQFDPGAHGGRTYELGGPQVMNMHELLAFICEATERNRPIVDIPDFLSRRVAQLTGWAPGAPITYDQWKMLGHDSIVSPGARGLEAFGIPRTPLIAVAEGWLTRYRRHGRFAAKSPY
ncbi:MAG TPA: complex I NDUFA9 subunit family protein [Allosphingosinicella sp.]|jgi:NADH dehydrogenase